MIDLLLKRLSLVSVSVLCAQPLLGSENFNPNPYFGSPNINPSPLLRQQRKPLPKPNEPWMDIVPDGVSEIEWTYVYKDIDCGYNTLVEMDKTIPCATMALLVFREIEQRMDSKWLPREIVHLIIDKLLTRSSSLLKYPLNLCGSRIQDIHLLRFPFPKFLTRLSLGDNKKITDEGVEHLTNLTYLNLYMNGQITTTGFCISRI